MDVIKPAIVLHTMASPESGYGHLNRCIILSQKLIDKGAIVYLLVIGDQTVRSFLSSFPWAIVCDQPPAEWPPADLCIVDMYCYDDDYYIQLRRHYEFIGIFDDVEYCIPKHVCCVINPNLYADASLYPPGIRVFHGAEMVLVRQDFLTPHKSMHQNRILVCVGASDPTNQMDRILRILTNMTAKPIDAVFGPWFEQKEIIDKWRLTPQVDCHYSVRNMEQLMQHACYAVTGCGSMLYECAVMGIPCACLCLADNQKLLAAAFQAVGAIDFLGCYQEMSDIEIEQRLAFFDTEQDARHSMANRAQKLIDGQGADRLSQAILNYVATRKDEKLSPYTKQEIEAEYEKSAKEAEDYKKLRWSSEENMINLFFRYA
jgi:spore coat polysaccharide biosynthesis predicted glycosyltransferase SpsG